MPTFTFAREIATWPASATKSDSSRPTRPRSRREETQNAAGSSSPGVAYAVRGFPTAVRTGVNVGVMGTV
jgi:hypothetical protein